MRFWTEGQAQAIQLRYRREQGQLTHYDWAQYPGQKNVLRPHDGSGQTPPSRVPYLPISHIPRSVGTTVKAAPGLPNGDLGGGVRATGSVQPTATHLLTPLHGKTQLQRYSDQYDRFYCGYQPQGTSYGDATGSYRGG